MEALQRTNSRAFLEGTTLGSGSLKFGIWEYSLPYQNLFTVLSNTFRKFVRLFCHYMRDKHATTINNTISDDFLKSDNEMELKGLNFQH